MSVAMRSDVVGARQSLPPELVLTETMKEFVAASIRSLEELEVLLALRALRQSSTSAELSATLHMLEDLVEAALQNLASSSILTRQGSGARASYAYAPATEALRLAVDELARACETHRVDVIMLISSKAIERVRSGVLQMFVDAKRISDA